MKPEANKEIDLLLRRMARGNGAARDGEVQLDDRHLDVDELSSYAQNALPAAARARYTEHLADCATCRKLVTELSLSLGSAVAESVETVHEPSGWKKFFASLFSPMVLRYAVPALGVIVVMVVGFVVLRRQIQHDFVAQLEERQASAPAASTETPSAPVYSVPAGILNGNASTAKSDSRGAAPQRGVADDKTAGVAGAAPATPAKQEQSRAESQPTVAPQSSPAVAKAAEPPPAPAQETVTVTASQSEVARERASAPASANSNTDRDQISTRGAQPGSAEEDKTRTEAKPEPTAGARFGMMGGEARRSRAQALKKVDENKPSDAPKDAENSTANEETRTIAGRHFRKQGNTWIDTAYQSSTATVNMARDSEQFRALVADEPAIGTIAKQLDGEVIVVWKGRAYRIR